MNDQPRYMISVAADLVGMHPQTLRIYEQKGLVRPKRTAGTTRLYSDADVEMREALREVHREYRRDLVLYRPPQPPATIRTQENPNRNGRN
jgi:hypothetical protein